MDGNIAREGDTIRVHGKIEVTVTKVLGDRVYFLDPEENKELYVDSLSEYEVIGRLAKAGDFKILSKTVNHIIVGYINDEEEIMHLVRTGDCLDNPVFFRFYKDAHDIQPWRTGIKKMSDLQIIEQFGIDPNTYWSIWDNDTQQYLHTARNSRTKFECFLDYLEYRKNDLEEWYADNEEIAPLFHNRYKDLEESAIIGLLDNEFEALFLEWVLEVCRNETFVLQDMAAANFTLESHENKLDEEY